MHHTVLLAVALQKRDRYSNHALAPRDVAATTAKSAVNLLHVLSVYEYEFPSASGLSADMVARQHEDILQRTDSLMGQRLDEFVAPLKEQRIEVKKLLKVGNPREVIVQVASSVTADLLIIGSHSKRGIFNIALGGTARQITSHAPCPVVLVSPKP